MGETSWRAATHLKRPGGCSTGPAGAAAAGSGPVHRHRHFLQQPPSSSRHQFEHPGQRGRFPGRRVRGPLSPPSSRQHDLAHSGGPGSEPRDGRHDEGIFGGALNPRAGHRLPGRGALVRLCHRPGRAGAGLAQQPPRRLQRRPVLGHSDDFPIGGLVDARPGRPRGGVQRLGLSAPRPFTPRLSAPPPSVRRPSAPRLSAPPPFSASAFSASAFSASAFSASAFSASAFSASAFSGSGFSTAYSDAQINSLVAESTEPAQWTNR